ncbi:MAG: FkbM family methyltransferase [Chloroflexota bacterium]
MIAETLMRRLPVDKVLTPARRRWIVKLLQRRARRYGYALVAAPPPSAGVPAWDIWTWVRATSSIKTIIDIGANDGQYAEYLNDFFKPAVVHAFEPLLGCQPQLAALSEKIPHLTVHQVALSDENGEATFYSNEYAPASSLLAVSDLARRAFPETERASASTVRLARLDDILTVDTLEPDILIKIDVQGVEDRVIRGGTAIFSVAKIVLIEMSFVPVYDGQPLFEEVHALLEGCGLRLAGFKNQIDDAQTGQPLFAHCLYRRSDDHPAP